MKIPTNDLDTRAERNPMILTEAFEAYRRDCIVFRNQSKKTEENHIVCMRSLVRFLGDIRVDELTFEDVRRWKSYLDKNRSTETVRNYIVKLRVVLQYLKHASIETLDPELVPIPQRSDKVPSFISKEQVEQLILANTKVRSQLHATRNMAVISLLFASGIRVSELCSLNRDSINDRSFTIIGKGGKARLCFIDDRTDLLINKYLAMRTEGFTVKWRNKDGSESHRVRCTYRPDNNAALFININKGRISSKDVQEIFKNTRKNCGLNIHVTPHTLRHSFATNLLKSNTNLFYVQQFLGHRSLQTTQQYLHVINEDLRSIYKKHHKI